MKYCQTQVFHFYPATMDIILLVIASLPIFVSSAATPIRPCMDNKPQPLNVQINNCTELPCIFTKGATVHMAIQFVATKSYISKINATVNLSSRGLIVQRIHFELLEEDRNVCNNLMYGAYCPLYDGEDVTYHLRLTLDANQSEAPIKVQVSLLDQSNLAVRNDVDDDDDDGGQVLACFVTDAYIKNYVL